MEFLFNYIQHARDVPLSGSVTQIVIDSSISAAKEGRNVQFVRLGMVCGCHYTPAKRHPYSGLDRENIFRHHANFFIFDPPSARDLTPVTQSNLHPVPLHI